MSLTSTFTYNKSNFGRNVRLTEQKYTSCTVVHDFRKVYHHVTPTTLKYSPEFKWIVQKVTENMWHALPDAIMPVNTKFEKSAT